MGRQANLRVVDQVLSNLAYGYQNAEFIADKLFPYAGVRKEGVKIPVFGKEHFKLYNTERALRAKSNRIQPEDIGSVSVTLTEHDLEYPLDYREEEEADFALDAYATGVATAGIRLRIEVQSADLAQNTASYPTGNKVTLSGVNQFTNASSDPEAVIRTAQEAIRQKIAKRPNTMVMGPSTWSVLQRHPVLRAILATDRPRMVTLADMRDIFQIPNIYVGDAVKASDAGVVSDVWGDNIILAYVPPNDGKTPRTPLEPSYGYTLRKGRPEVDAYVEGNGKIRVVRSTDVLQPYLLGAEAGYIIADTNA